MVFGYGTLTWEWSKLPIRSPLGFIHYSALYYILKILKIDSPLLVAYSPRLIIAL